MLLDICNVVSGYTPAQVHPHRVQCALNRAAQRSPEFPNRYRGDGHQRIGSLFERFQVFVGGRLPEGLIGAVQMPEQ